MRAIEEEARKTIICHETIYGFIYEKRPDLRNICDAEKESIEEGMGRKNVSRKGKS